jgi:glycosyltransferase involved in cell wall biosynthesis
VLRLCSVFETQDDPSDQDAAFDPVGGMQVHTAALTRALDDRGVSQWVVTTRPPTAPRRQRIGAAHVYRVGFRIRRPRQLYSVPASVLVPALARRADLVHVHLGEDLAALPIAAAAARLAGRLPLVVTLHCSLRHTLKVVDARTAVLAGLGGWIEERGVRLADAVVVLSHRAAGLLAGAGVDRSRIHVIPPGIDRRAFAGPFPDPFPEVPRPRVLFVGRLHRAKGVDTALAAFSGLGASGAHLVVVGDGPERAAVEAAARAPGLRGRVRCTGFLPHDRVPAVLSHADVLVVPSVYEELGRIVLEGMQAGLPVVAASTGGIPEVIHDGVNGLLVPPRDPVALARAVDAVLARPGLAARLRAAAFRDAERYDADALVDRVLDAYRDALARREADGRVPRAATAGTPGLPERPAQVG